MRLSFLIFFGLVFTVYFSVQAYLFVRGWQALALKPRWRPVYAVIFWFCALAFLAGRNLENREVTIWSTGLIAIGSLWFAFMYYLFLGTLTLDVAGRLGRWLGWLPDSWIKDAKRLRFRAAVILLTGVTIVVGWGFWNALHPEIVRREVSLPAVSGAPSELRVVVASDWHLGTLVTQSRVKSWVDTINALHPDLVLLPGDVIDEDLPPVVENNLGDYLKNLRAPLGVFAVTGNHEYIGGVEAAVRYLEDHNVRVLRDRAVSLSGGALWLAGREDASITRFLRRQRAPLREVLLGIPPGAPVVLMDHQPLAMAEAEALGVDVMLSGHTHDGQLWPNKYIVKSLFGVSSGPFQFGAMQGYVLPGLGTWGPPVRVGNRPQILLLTLRFEGTKQDEAVLN